jgi:hypothetical protein
MRTQPTYSALLSSLFPNLVCTCPNQHQLQEVGSACEVCNGTVQTKQHEANANRKPILRLAASLTNAADQWDELAMAI